MRWLIFALLLATLICTIATAIKASSQQTGREMAVNGYLLQATSDPEDDLFPKEFSAMVLASLSFVLLPVLAGYSSFRLTLTYHRFLFTVIAIFILMITLMVMTGLFEVTIHYEKMTWITQRIGKFFGFLGWVRTIALGIGAFAGVRAYLNDRRRAFA